MVDRKNMFECGPIMTQVSLCLVKQADKQNKNKQTNSTKSKHSS